MAETSGRLSMSEETLRRLLAEFKTELVEELKKYATVAAHEAVEARVRSLELWQASVTGAGLAKDKISRASIAWAGLAVAALTALATVIWLRHG